MTHDLKTHPGHFEELWSGRKTFEVRKDDRGYMLGDVLNLREYDPAKDEFSGRLIRFRVPHLLRGPAFGLSADSVVMSLVFVGRRKYSISPNPAARPITPAPLTAVQLERRAPYSPFTPDDRDP